MAQNNSVFACTLLYSKTSLPDPSEDLFLRETLQRINNDGVLSKHIHPVCIDCQQVKQHLLYNEAGIKIKNWPVFVAKFPQQNPRIYQLNQQEALFKQIQQLSLPPVKQTRPPPPPPPSPTRPPPTEAIEELPPTDDLLDGIVDAEYEPDRTKKPKSRHLQRAPYVEKNAEHHHKH